MSEGFEPSQAGAITAAFIESRVGQQMFPVMPNGELDTQTPREPHDAPAS